MSSLPPSTSLKLDALTFPRPAVLGHVYVETTPALRRRAFEFEAPLTTPDTRRVRLQPEEARLVRVQRQRPGATGYVDDACRRRFTKEWQHRLRDGDDAEHVRLEHRAHLVERRDACAARFHNILERPDRFSRTRYSRIVHEHVETAELLPDALCRGGDGGLIRDGILLSF
jgi:hypothetical protein